MDCCCQGLPRCRALRGAGLSRSIGRLLDYGFEGYAVDYRHNRQTYYLPDGDSIEFDIPDHPGMVAADFDSAVVEALVRWAQADGPDYSYAAFCRKVMAAGCAAYLVSFLGRRVVYYGRTAETHVELFPHEPIRDGHAFLPRRDAWTAAAVRSRRSHNNDQMTKSGSGWASDH